MVGIVMLIGLMFIIAFNDIQRIVGGDSFFPKRKEHLKCS